MTGRVTTTALCLHATLASHRSSSHRGCFFPNASSKVVQPGALARPPLWTDFSWLDDPTDCPDIFGQGEPTRRLTNNSAAASSVGACAPCPRISLSGLPSTPLLTSLVAATRCEARLAGLLPPAFAWHNTLIRSRWGSRRRLRASAKTPGAVEWRCYDNTCASSTVLQQLPARHNLAPVRHSQRVQLNLHHHDAPAITPHSRSTDTGNVAMFTSFWLGDDFSRSSCPSSSSSCGPAQAVDEGC